MSSEIHAVAIITPKPGKFDEVVEGLKALTDYVEANEPGVLRYQMHKQLNTTDGAECIVFIEVFKDKETLDAHRKGPVYTALQERAKGEENLLAAPIDVKVLQSIGGFASR